MARGLDCLAVLDVSGAALQRARTRLGLPVMRYSPETLSEELGDGFRLVGAEAYEHHTPWGSMRSFQDSRLVRVH